VSDRLGGDVEITMAERHTLLAVLAHPDDESLGFGGTLARYAAEGVDVHVVTATRGEKGRVGPEGERPGPEVAAPIRERELRAAADELGVATVAFLDYIDGELDDADPVEAMARIGGHIRRVRPQVVVTFAPDGAYGHPDHIAISQLTTAAVVAAAAPDRGASSEAEPHRVSKLYYLAWTRSKWDAYQSAFKELVSRVDGEDRRVTPWPEWAISARIDTVEHWPTVWRAVQCHESQVAVYGALGDLGPEHHRALWGSQEFYRAYSLVNGGRRLETDVFQGLDRSGLF
jgi:LmbE family N-acetylglucosaminyl deacetylase